MNTNTAVAEGFESAAGTAAQTQVTGKSIWRRIFDKMAANAQRQAMARLAAIDPRFAAELRAAKDRAEGQAQI